MLHLLVEALEAPAERAQPARRVAVRRRRRRDLVVGPLCQSLRPYRRRLQSLVGAGELAAL